MIAVAAKGVGEICRQSRGNYVTWYPHLTLYYHMTEMTIPFLLL